MTEILPLVFSCVNQEEITFCKDYKIIAEDQQTIVAMAQNYGLASSGARYDQVYVHILTFHDGKLVRLIDISIARLQTAHFGVTAPTTR